MSTKKQIEGPDLAKGSNVVLIDDVASTGGSLINAKRIIAKLKKDISISKAIVIIDQVEGASENLAKHDVELVSIFKINEIIK